MSSQKFTDTMRKTENNVGSNVFLRRFLSFFLGCQAWETSKNYESEYDETSKAVEELEEGPQIETTTREINRLTQRQVNQKIKIRVTPG
jgi:hypothetical protein